MAETHRDRRLVLRLIGLGFFLAGLAAAFIGPMEIHAYYLFIDEGRFHYEGFGFGSFMFAYITLQVVGYYAVAAIGIVLGYGHLAVRRWARSLSETLLWLWLVLGLPLTAVAVLMFFVSKEPEAGAVVVTLLAGPLLYPVAPILLYRFYRSSDVRKTFAQADDRHFRFEEIPLPVRGLCGFLIFAIVMLHFPMLLRGVFPFFGTLLSGMQGVIALDCLILALAFLAWGLARLDRWAWWGALVVVGLTTASVVVTFARHTYRDLLLAMQFPAAEMQLFENVPFLDGYPAVVFAIPGVVALVILLVSGKHFFRREHSGPVSEA
jgi:hypothetical protein